MPLIVLLICINLQVFLLPNEETYINFIALNQKVELKSMELDEVTNETKSLLPILRDWQKNDRKLFDLANRAFVSHIQSYSKHECQYVLRLKRKFVLYYQCT